MANFQCETAANQHETVSRLEDNQQRLADRMAAIDKRLSDQQEVLANQERLAQRIAQLHECMIDQLEMLANQQREIVDKVACLSDQRCGPPQWIPP